MVQPSPKDRLQFLRANQLHPLQNQHSRRQNLLAPKEQPTKLKDQVPASESLGRPTQATAVASLKIKLTPTLLSWQAQASQTFEYTVSTATKSL
jgi:hypothetical protein